MTSRSLITEFPTLVKVPQAREAYLLQWYTQDGGNEVIVASTIDNAVAIFKGLFKRHKGIEPKKFFKAKFVSPPSDLQVKNAQQDFDNMCEQFKSTLEWMGRSLPKEALTCPSHPKPRHPDDYRDPEECKVPDCHGGILMTDERFLELCWAEHDRKKAEKAAADAKFTKKYGGQTSPSQAPAPVDGTVYVCESNGGHHCSGVTLEVVGNSKGNGYGRPEYMFFFQGQELPLPKGVSLVLIEDKKAQIQAEKDAKARGVERRKQQKEEEIAKAKELFGIK